MFKSIQWKLVTMFVILVLAIMIVFGTFLQERITVFYHETFMSEMNVVFLPELTDQLFKAEKTENSAETLKNVLDVYSGRLGLNSNRNYFILDKTDGHFISGSQSYSDPEITANIIAAMAGKTGSATNVNLPYIDYAYPLSRHIIYVKDNKQELLALNNNVIVIIAQALLIGILLSLVLGFFMSRTLTRPIANLTKKAQSISEGNYAQRIDVKSDDELGKLAATFNDMAVMIKNSMDEISREKNKLETVLQHMNDGVLAFDTDRRLILINSEAKAMLGIKDDTSITFDSYFKSLGLTVTMSELLYLKSMVKQEIEFGGKYFNAFFATFKSDNTALSSGVVVVIQDLTDMQQLELSRREFVANVSHELRTPLTTIKTYAETMAESADNDDDKHFLGVIVHEVDRMTRIVKDLLTLSSLDHRKLSIFKKEFSIDKLLYEVVTKLSVEARSLGKKITYTATTELPKICADRDRIEQVIINIISNSVKYTGDNGVIQVFAGFLYNEIYIKIKDNGIGIPKEDLPKVFERFYRVDKARSREKGGTGLGLSIAYEIIKLHGGTISIDSVRGEGTEVIIKLPVNMPA